MAILKKISLLTTAVALAGCMIEAEQEEDIDSYFKSDFGTRKTSVTVEKTAAPAPVAEKPVVKQQSVAEPVVVADVIETEALPESKVTPTVIKMEQAYDSISQTIKESDNAFKEELKQRSVKATRDYYEQIAYINAKLQIGTTPENPDLLNALQKAAGSLNEIGNITQEMKSLNSDVVKINTKITNLLNAIAKAYTLPGAYDSDHERLQKVEDNAGILKIKQQRLTNELSTLIVRQDQIFKKASEELTKVSGGVRSGKTEWEETSVSTNPAQKLAVSTSIIPTLVVEDDTVPNVNVFGRKAQVTIGFDAPYEQDLYTATQKMLDRRPSAKFEIVGVYKTTEFRSEASKYAQDVQASLLEMGLPENRIQLGKARDPNIKKSSEVRIFVK
ncbi:MAG: hypothetical protein MJ250_05445 [Alphaproteobacteria bacterium]|nr:hypothetical protein [Alphaproteobacteria bacterium]